MISKQTVECKNKLLEGSDVQYNGRKTGSIPILSHKAFLEKQPISVVDSQPASISEK